MVCIRKVLIFILPVIGMVFSSSLYADDEYYHEITSQRSSELPFWMIEKDAAKATLVFFAGGHGKLKLNQNGIRKLKNNFLVRSRDAFASQGFNIAIVDKPDDRDNLYGFRLTAEHASDIESLIKYLRKEYKKPVWLVGTSRGTLSVANAAARLHGANGPDGIVMTATVVVKSRRDSVQQVELAKIKVPTLFVHNRDDACHVCPYAGVSATMAKLSKVKDIQLISVQGGQSEASRPCQALTPHGFLGLEDKVIKDITDWIKPRLKQRRKVSDKGVTQKNI
ncbi:MAG: alpha/beta hydrolase [Gammaproteobacteria bacterium]|nr:alpha/beta hydrolase [Gammaproteobacteria bacterium]